VLSMAGQVLSVSQVEQEQDQWCWAACSKNILDYYGFSKKQCEIVEWVRKTATFHNFGSTECCTNASKGCNYWNYNYDEKGSIQDILVYFGKLQNVGVAAALTQSEIQTELTNNRLFVIRWGWSQGGGHFIVGHGVNGSNLYYMNPWFGEGKKIGTYSWVKKGAASGGDTHTWTHTNKITTVVTGIDKSDASTVRYYPNPLSSVLTIEGLKPTIPVTLEIMDMLGKVCFSNEFVPSTDKTTFNTSELKKGMYILKLRSASLNTEGKIVVQ
ncbi:MAG TPA: T9SS type A sorting domain-containing protein, partial [Bacteroidia bacterium]|nr:T9SS type A sorting domain-containing protein [Bacteroidia bacterium]